MLNQTLSSARSFFVLGLGFGEGLGSRVWGLRGLGSRVWGLRGLGSRVWGLCGLDLGFGVCVV